MNESCCSLELPHHGCWHGCPQQQSAGHASSMGGCLPSLSSLTWSRVLPQICQLWGHCIVSVYLSAGFYPLRTSLSVFSLTKIIPRKTMNKEWGIHMTLCRLSFSAFAGKKRKNKPWRIKTRSVLFYFQIQRWGYPSWQWSLVVKQSQPEKHGNQIRAPFWLSLSLVVWIWASCLISLSLSLLTYEVRGC